MVLVVLGMAIYVLLPQGLHIRINDGTTPLKSDEIPLSTVPTLINGIVTSTSIVIAFGGTIIGFQLSRLPKKDKRRTKLDGLLAMFAFSFVYMFIAYEWSVQGAGFFEFGLRNAMAAFLLAFLILLIVFLHIATMVEKENETDETESGKPKPDESKTTNQNKNAIDAKKEEAKGLVEKARQMRFFYKGVFIGLFYGIMGNMLVSHYYAIFTAVEAREFDSLFWWNVLFFIIFLCIVAFVSYKVWRSMAKIEGFLKAVDKIKEKYGLDDNFNEKEKK